MLAAFDAACCAANGVPLRDPRKPSDPELFHASTLPLMSEMVTMVLLKEACTCTSPCGTCLRSFFLNVFFLPFFSGAAVPPAAAGFAIVSVQWSVASGQLIRSLLATDHWTLDTALSFRRRLLLRRHRTFAWALPGARVGMGARPPARQAAAGARTTVVRQAEC